MEPEKKPLEKEKHRTKPAIFGFHVSCRGCSPLFFASKQCLPWPKETSSRDCLEAPRVGPIGIKEEIQEERCRRFKGCFSG